MQRPFCKPLDWGGGRRRGDKGQTWCGGQPCVLQPSHSSPRMLLGCVFFCKTYVESQQVKAPAGKKCWEAQVLA